MTTRICKLLLLTALAAAELGRATAGAAALEHAEHRHLHVDSALTLRDVVDRTLVAYPDFSVLEASRGLAAAWSDRGQSWIGNRPSLVMRYQSDRWGPDTGLDEYEAGIELPLWAWGLRKAVKQYGDALGYEADAAALALRWEVAGVVRRLYWAVAQAENTAAIAEESVTMSARMLGIVQRRFELGDVAQRDVLLAQSSQLQSEAALIAATAELADAERSYLTITGLDDRPPFEAESVSAATGISDEHPALRLADLAVASSEANVPVSRNLNASGPSLLLGTRRERPAYGTELDNSIGITVSIPFGGSSHLDTAAAQARRAVAQAKAERARQLRQLTLDLHEASHSLSVVDASLAGAEKNLDISERNREMGEIAYEQGEIDLTDLLRIQQATLEARLRVSRLRIERQRQTSFYNQAVGALP